MKLQVNISDVLENPVIEHTICSFASVSKGSGQLIVSTDLITKKVGFKVVGNTGKTTTNDLAEAITLYNLISL